MYSRTAQLVKVLAQANQSYEDKPKLLHHIDKVKSIVQGQQLDRSALSMELAHLEKKMHNLLSFERKLAGKEGEIVHLEHQLNDMRSKLSLADSKQLRRRLDRILFLLGELGARADAHAQSNELHDERVAQIDKKINSFMEKDAKKNKLELRLSALEARYAKLNNNSEIPLEHLQAIEARLHSIRQKYNPNEHEEMEKFTFQVIPRPRLVSPEEVQRPVAHRFLSPHSEGLRMLPQVAKNVEAELELPSINGRKGSAPYDESENPSSVFSKENGYNDLSSIVTLKRAPHHEKQLSGSSRKNQLLEKNIEQEPSAVNGNSMEQEDTSYTQELTSDRSRLPTETNDLPSVVTVNRKPLLPKLPAIISIKASTFSGERNSSYSKLSTKNPLISSVTDGYSGKEVLTAKAPPIAMPRMPAQQSRKSLPSIITVKHPIYEIIRSEQKSVSSSIILPSEEDEFHAQPAFSKQSTMQEDAELPSAPALNLKKSASELAAFEEQKIELPSAPQLRLKKKHMELEQPPMGEKPNIELPPAPRLHLKSKVKRLPKLEPLQSPIELPPAPQLRLKSKIKPLSPLKFSKSPLSSLPKINLPPAPQLSLKNKVPFLPPAFKHSSRVSLTLPQVKKQKPLRILQLLHIAKSVKKMHHQPLHFLPPIRKPNNARSSEALHFLKLLHSAKKKKFTVKKEIKPQKPLHLLKLLHIAKSKRRPVKKHPSNLLNLLPRISLKKKQVRLKPLMAPKSSINLEDVPSPPHDKVNIEAELAEMKAQIEAEQRSHSRRKKA